MKPYQSYLTFLILFIFLGSTIAAAQDAEVKDEPKTKISHESLVLESNTLLEDINNLSKKTAALRLHIKTTAKVDRFLFFSLISTIEDKLRGKLDRVIEIKTILDTDKVYVNLHQKVIQAIILKQSTILQQEIITVSEIVIKMRNKKNKEDISYYAIDRAEKKLDFLFTEWHKTIGKQ